MADSSTPEEPKDESPSPGSGSGEGSPGLGGSSPPRPAPPPLQWDKFMDTIRSRKIDTAMWVTRFATIIFGFLFLVPLPLFGYPANFYYKAMMAAAATSALRLHQRLPVVQFNRMFLANLVLEDSFHYLCYAVIFIMTYPMTLAILPVLLFAVLHFASFSLTLLDQLGRHSGWIGRIFISLVEFQAVTILRLAASAEIMIFPFIVFYTFGGKLSIFTPVLYYRFLTFRYASRRNHYTRTMFSEFRMQFEALANSPKCPAMISNLLRQGIGFVSRLAPAQLPPPPN